MHKIIIYMHIYILILANHKKNKIQSFVVNWMELMITMLNEMSNMER